MAISSPEMILVPVWCQYKAGVRCCTCDGHTKVDITEGTGTNLAADSVFVAYAEILLCVVSVRMVVR